MARGGVADKAAMLFLLLAAGGWIHEAEAQIKFLLVTESAQQDLNARYRYDLIHRFDLQHL